MIQSFYSDQMPLIGGETDRAFFGTGDIPPVNSIRVIQLHSNGSNIVGLTLEGGTLHGIQEESKYGIYTSTDEADSAAVNGAMLAEVKITDVAQQTSEATLDVPANRGEIKVGYKAILLSIPSGSQSSAGFSNSVTNDIEDMFRRAWNTVPDRHRARICILPRNERGSRMYIINVNEDKRFEILDGDGFRIPNLEPPLRSLPASELSSSGPPKFEPAKILSFANRVIYRLGHLALFNAVKTLVNPNELSPIRSAFEVVVLGKDNNQARTGSTPVDEHNAAYNIKHDESLVFQVKNTWKKELHFTVLDLQPLYGITKVYPWGGGDMEQLDVGKTTQVRLTMTIPSNFEGNDCVDTFKFIATPKPTSLTALELDDLYDTEGKYRGNKSKDPLRDMLENLNFGLRNGRCKPVDEWVVESINVRTSRGSVRG